MIGWENIELISDRPLEVMLKDMARLKQEYPDRWLGGKGFRIRGSGLET